MKAGPSIIEAVTGGVFQSRAGGVEGGAGAAGGGSAGGRCSGSDAGAGCSLSLVPQIGQKYATGGNSALQCGQRSISWSYPR
jgi:hypothetical protein